MNNVNSNHREMNFNSPSRYVPSLQSQLQYLVEWFKEFSELQKSDFLPVIAQRFSETGYVNGEVNNTLPPIPSLHTNPPSLFQCRVQLFLDWTETWGLEEQQQLLLRIKEIDPVFAEKYEQEVSGQPVVCIEDGYEEPNL